MNEQSIIRQQYRTASNLDTRIMLHRKFSTNRYGWHRWLFDRLRLSPGARVLEVGCGAGDLWSENVDRIPDGIVVVLTDLSPGMIRKVINTVSMPDEFQIAALDVQSIPLASGRLDAVLANHMLYHVPDLERALAEAARVLGPGGVLFAATIGSRHMIELHEFLVRFDPALDLRRRLKEGYFSLDNGAAFLRPFFPHVSLQRYADTLAVSDANALVDYILSMQFSISPSRTRELADRVRRWMDDLGGQILISKDTGVFIARKDGAGEARGA